VLLRPVFQAGVRCTISRLSGVPYKKEPGSFVILGLARHCRAHPPGAPRGRVGNHYGEASVTAKTIPRHARMPPRQREVPRPNAARIPAPAVPGTAPPRLADGRADAGPLAGPVAITEQAVLGDTIRRPSAWCEMPCCISRHEHPAALGEADVRARALAAGWCHDAVGRLVCPSCQQRNPDLWIAYRLARQNRAPARGTRQDIRHARAGRLSGVRAAVSGLARAFAGSQDRRPQWSHLLATPVSADNGWNAGQAGLQG